MLQVIRAVVHRSDCVDPSNKDRDKSISSRSYADLALNASLLLKYLTIAYGATSQVQNRSVHNHGQLL